MKPGLLLTWPGTRYADHTAIVFNDTRLTFSEMEARINRLANGLLSLGLTTGCKVAVLLDNSLESAEALFAIPRAGLTYVSLNARHSSGEHVDILNDSEADALIVGQHFLEKIEPQRTALPYLKHLIVVGQGGPGLIPYTDLTVAQPETIPDIDIDYESAIERIQYTSGTTGKPKGVVWSFATGYNVLTSVLMNMDRPIGPGTVNLNIGPLTHAAGLMMMVYYARGARNVLLPGFDEQKVLDTIVAEKVSELLLIPTMFYRLLQYPALCEYDLSRIKRIWYGTAPMAIDRLQEGIRIFGKVFRQNYGMTEIAQPITYLGPEEHVIDGTEPERRRLASAGKPALGVEVKIVDENGKRVKPGEVGEILVRSNKLMKGYWKKPAETEAAFAGTWFRTRDMATTDEDGYIYIMDRKSNMIISGGFNIYPREVEDVIMAHSSVAETAVIGVPDPLWGEAVKAVVVLKSGCTLTAAELIAHCKENLASYKKPKSVEFLKAIPKNLYGKTDRRALRAPYWEGYDRFIH